VVILGGNQQMGDIPPLQASAASLKQLEISSTAIADLAVLAEAGKLEESAAAPVKEALEGLIQEQGSKFANGKSMRRLFEQVQTN
jgi:hypothetical protein